VPSARLILGGAAATAAVGVRVARSLYGRWRMLPQAHREQIAGIAEHAKERALAARGAANLDEAATELRAANETLAAALIETAEADPELSPEDVHELREDLRRELDRIASADIKASRTRRVSPTPPG